jgi:hypothetical protein
VFIQGNQGLKFPVGNLNDSGAVTDTMGCWRIDVDSMRKARATLGTTDVADIVEIYTLDNPSGVVLRLVLAMCKIRTLIVMTYS